MQPTDTFVPRDDNVASEDFDGEFVVLDLASGKYFGLSGGSALVWRAMLAGHSVNTLCANLAEGDARRAQIAGLLATLMENGLIVAASDGRVAPAELAAELSGVEGPFLVETFDDLADLMLTDPIHDVDQEAGWPKRPNED
ncbi:MAG: PqqD family protein [Devosia sp.]